MSTTADPAAVSDGDRLIAALQTCFIDLAKKQEEQGEKLYRAVEALKPQPPTTDKKTAFWNSYMKLADEYDKEFQQKYITDLDTALIFSGLFSAVASAFVIQIEPQLTTNPPKIIVIVQCMLYTSLFTTLLAALLAVLGKQWLMYYQAAGSRGTIEERGLERQRKLDGLVKWKFEAVLQAFPLLLQLALLLFASSISVYLWTVHRSVAILLTVLTALGLGSYICLLVSATIFSDCPFQTPVRPILVACFTALQHIFLQLRHFVSRQLIFYILKVGIRWIMWSNPIFSKLRDMTRQFLQSSGISGSKLNLLPRFSSHNLQSTDKYAKYKSIEASPEVPAVLWAFDTSTDHAMNGVAAELGADLQWPIQLDRSAETTLRSLQTAAFYLCVDYSSGTVMSHLAVAWGKLYCTLNLHVPPERHLSRLSMSIEASNSTGEPAAILQIQTFQEDKTVKVELPGDSATTVKWVLHIIPSLAIPLKDKMRYLARNFPIEAQVDIFANFLCCVGAASVPVEPWLIRTVDKSGLCCLLMNRFFIALRHLAATDMAVTLKLLDTAAQLAIELAPQFPRASFDERVNLVREMSEFCNKFPRVESWLDVVVTAAKLGRTSLTGLRKIHLRTEFGYGRNPNPLLPRFGVRDMEWIYLALEHVQTAWQEGLGDAEDKEWDNNTLRSINGLLQVLSCNDSLPDNPPVPSLKVILRALCSPTGVAATALLVLSRAKSWFLNPDLQPIMLQFSMWHHLGRVARCYKEEDRSGEDVITDSYQHILQHVAPRSEWKSALFEELPTCIAIFSDPSGSRWFDEEPQKLDFISVLRNIWVPQFPHIEGQQQQIEVTDAGQQCTALCFVALSNVWERHDMAKSSLEQFLQLARCTVSTALPWNVILSSLQNFLPFFSSRLCRALAQAAANTRHSIQVGIPGGLDAGSSRVEAHLARRMVELLEMLIQRLEIEFNNPDRLGREVLRRRDTLRDEIAAEIKAWEESLGHGEEGVPAEASAAQVGQQDGGEEEEGGRIAIAVD